MLRSKITDKSPESGSREAATLQQYKDKNKPLPKFY